MRIRALTICAAAVSAWTSVAPAGAWAQTLPFACHSVSDTICWTGSGIVSSVSGDISLERAGAVSQIGSGAAILSGDRILARNGAGQVGLGQTCFAFMPANSISVVTEQDGLTCLRPSTAAGTATGPAFNATAVGLGLAGLAGVGAAIAIASSHPSLSP
jgi:hypothetical protein